MAYLIVVTLLAPSFGTVNFAQAEELGNESAELSLEESATYSEEMQEERRQAEEELREKERNIEPDQYETDDFCHQAGELLVNTPQPQHSLHTPEDVDWVKLRVEGVSELDFLLETYDPASAGGSKFSLYRECENGPQVPVLLAASDAKIKNPFKADGSYYIKVESVQQVVVPAYTLLLSSHPKAGSTERRIPANMQGLAELQQRPDNVRKFPKGQFLPEVLEPASLILTPQQVEELRLPANRDPEAEEARDEREQERLQLTVPRSPEREELEYYNKASTGWQTIMTENGEGSFPRGNNWRVYDDNSGSGRDYWDDLSCRDHWGRYSIWASDIGDMRNCQRYDNNMNAWMIYGPFDLSDATQAKLEFYYWNNTESGYDYFKWLASSNGRNFQGDQTSGNSGGWRSQTLDLASYVGDSSVWVAFLFESDGSVTKEGAYVDDITLQKSVTPTDDPYEENDTLSRAYDLRSSEGRWLSSINGKGIQADHDWYKIYVNSGEERVKIDCRFTHSAGDIDLKLYNASGRSLKSSTGTRDNELIDYTVPRSGTYYLKVYYGNQGNTYDLKWDDLPAAKPDLIVSSVTGTQSSYQIGDRINATATIKNNGNASAGSSDVKYYLGTSADKTYKYIEEGEIGSLAAGATETDDINYWGWTIPEDVPAGTYYIWVQADSSSELAESNEQNNWGQSTSFTLTSPEPEIEITPISLNLVLTKEADGLKTSLPPPQAGSRDLFVQPEEFDPTKIQSSEEEERSFALWKQLPTTETIKKVKINREAFSFAEIKIQLSPELAVTAIRREIKQKDEDTFIWVGDLKGRQESLIFVVDEKGVTATIRVGGEYYRIYSLNPETHVLIDVDESKFLEGDCVDEESTELGKKNQHSAFTETSKVTPAAHQATVITVLVAYTDAAAKAANGNIARLIEDAEEETNESYKKSGITQRIQVVHTEQVKYTTTGDSKKDINRFQGKNDNHLDEVHALRDRYAADVMVLITNPPNYSGRAFEIGAKEDQAFAVINWDYLTWEYTFGHEIGHLQGARHDPYVDNDTSPYAYGHGYVYLSGQPANNWRTIMAYRKECDDNNTSCPKIQYWSNPNVKYNKVAVGTAATHDNARVLDETAQTVAGFRTLPQASFKIKNTGTVALAITSITKQNSSNWLTLSSSAPFRIAPNREQIVTVSVQSSLVPGNYTERLLIYSNDADESPYPRGVNINLTVSTSNNISIKASPIEPGQDGTVTVEPVNHTSTD